MDRIEKSAFHAGEYVGYDSKGYARRIRRSTSSYGRWCAYPHANQPRETALIYAWTLAEMNGKLAATDSWSAAVLSAGAL